METIIIAAAVLGLGYFIYTRISGRGKRGGGSRSGDKTDQH